jgi:AmmeMemoRadiSam system protein B
MRQLRQPAVAGLFYPDDPKALRPLVADYLRAARPVGCHPHALIVPHAGYRYSGAVAAAGYACLSEAQRGQLRRVILLGTAHTRGATGLIASAAEQFLGPLGPVPVDRHAVDEALLLPQVHLDDDVHARDHALEVQLPFLQVLVPQFAVVPFLVGATDDDAVAAVLELLWRPNDCLVVVSSDLSHFHAADTARAIDQRTADAILALDGAAVGPQQACGHHAIRGLLAFARRQGWRAVLLELASSGDTSGERDRVVGYGAFAFTSICAS